MPSAPVRSAHCAMFTTAMQFSVVAKAGEGTYGIVYKAVSRKDPQHVVAIKEMRHDDQVCALR